MAPPKLAQDPPGRGFGFCSTRCPRTTCQGISNFGILSRQTPEAVKAELTSEEILLKEETAVSERVATDIKNSDVNKSPTSKSKPSLALSNNVGRSSTSGEAMDLPDANQISIPTSNNVFVEDVLTHNSIDPQEETINYLPKTEDDLCFKFLNTYNTPLADINMDKFITGKDLPLNQSNVHLLDSSIENTSTSQDMEQPIIDNVTGSNSYRQSADATNHIPGDGVMNNIDNTPKNKLTCSICQFKAVSKQLLFFHLYEIHLRGEYSIKFRCKICNFKSNLKRLIFLHEKICHNKGNNAPGRSIITNDISLSKNVEITVFREKSSSNTEENERIKDNLETEVIGEKSNAKNSENDRIRDNVGIEVIREKQSTSNNNENDDIVEIVEAIRDKSSSSNEENERIRDNVEIEVIGEKQSTSNNNENNDIVEIVEVIRDKSSLSNEENERIRDNVEIEVIGEKSSSSNKENERIGDKVEIIEVIDGEKQSTSNNNENDDIAEIVEVIGETSSSSNDGNARRANPNYYDNEDEDTNLENYLHRCFDCDYKTPEKYHLQNHAVKHLGSKFTCTEHASLKNNCRLCIYQYCLLKLKDRAQTCNVCGYTTCKIARFKEHRAACPRKAAVKRKTVKHGSSQNTTANNVYNHHKYTYKCFDCNYNSVTENLLKNHAMKHLKSEFICTEHFSLKDDCDACIYQSCLVYACTRIKICHCGYKTCRQLYFEAHQRRQHNIVREEFKVTVID